jgi:hypothetical protein
MGERSGQSKDGQDPKARRGYRFEPEHGVACHGACRDDLGVRQPHRAVPPGAPFCGSSDIGWTVSRGSVTTPGARE